MDVEETIVATFTKIMERADAFRHGQEALFSAISLAELHCIHWIGSLNQPNVTNISNKLGMTRGGVSKLVKKLDQKKYVERFQKDTNKKEVFFALTPAGKTLYNVHLSRHETAKNNKLRVVEKYTPAEQATILRFLQEMQEHLEQESTEPAKSPLSPKTSAK